MERKPILIVDDDEEIVELFQSVLEAEGYHVDSALSGQEALEKASNTEFSVALLDIVLPDILGTGVALELKTRYPNIAIVFITGHSELLSALDMNGFGACDLIIKPISMKRLVEIVESSLTIHSDYLTKHGNIVDGVIEN